MKNRLVYLILIISAVSLCSCGKVDTKVEETLQLQKEEETTAASTNGSSSGYVLADPKKQEDESTIEISNITDTDMSASDKTRLNRLMEEIGRGLRD